MFAIVVATETFRPLVLAQAKARRVDPRLITVAHPLGGLNAEEMAGRIAAARSAFTSLTGVVVN